MQRMEKYSRRRYHKNDCARKWLRGVNLPTQKKIPVAHAQFLDVRGRSSKWNNAWCNSLTVTGLLRAT